MEVLERLSKFVGQPLEFTSDAARAAIQGGLESNSKSKGAVDPQVMNTLHAYYRPSSEVRTVDERMIGYAAIGS